jgi:hypothetical protein
LDIAGLQLQASVHRLQNDIDEFLITARDFHAERLFANALLELGNEPTQEVLWVTSQNEHVLDQASRAIDELTDFDVEAMGLSRS